MNLKIDHVTIAGRELATLAQAFADLGLPTDYGGAHSNNITHMALLGFDDGSYIELISMLRPGEQSPLWHDQIFGDAGLCAWAVEADDINLEAARLAALGIAVNGPHYMNRARADGLLAEWDLAFIGEHSPGAKLPFIIKDRAPRAYRAPVSASVAGSELSGIKKVVLAVENLAASIKLFQSVYGWPAPEQMIDNDFNAQLADFTDAPVMLATPLAAKSWLADRLREFGELPCACLIASRDLAASAARLPLLAPNNWFGHNVRWLAAAKLRGIRIALVEAGRS